MSDPTARLLRDWTTLRVGGPAREWITAETNVDVREAVAARSELLVLGGGSNLVVGDAGVDATVLRLATRGVAVTESAGHVDLEVMAGESWDDLVAFCVHEGWSGIEALSGIPGLVGATPVQNVGAYGQEIAHVIIGVRALDRVSGEEVWLAPEECAFGYRTSRFKAEPGRWIVLSVGLRLAIAREGSARYAELASTLGVTLGARAAIDEIRSAVLLLRRRKGMVLDDADHDTWSAGSFFMNPIVTDEVAARIDPACPRYPATLGTKLSAAWLIQAAGITPGFCLPGSRAAVSTKHVLALTNTGGATATQILDLARVVRQRVLDSHAIELAIEPVVVGD